MTLSQWIQLVGKVMEAQGFEPDEAHFYDVGIGVQSKFIMGDRRHVNITTKEMIADAVSGAEGIAWMTVHTAKRHLEK